VLLQLLDTRVKEIEQLFPADPNFLNALGDSITKLSSALNLHEKRAALITGRDMLTKELAALQSEKKKVDLVEKALNLEIAELKNFFGIVANSVNRCTTIISAELSALAELQKLLPELESSITLDLQKINALDVLNFANSSIPRTLSYALTIPGIPLQDTLIAQCSNSEMNFTIALQKLNAVQLRALQFLHSYHGVITRSNSPIDFLKMSVTSEWRSYLGAIEDEYKQFNGVIPQSEDEPFELLEVVKDALNSYNANRLERLETAKESLSGFIGRLHSEEAELRATEALLAHAEVQIQNAAAEVLKTHTSLSEGVTAHPQDSLTSTQLLLNSLGISPSSSLCLSFFHLNIVRFQEMEVRRLQLRGMSRICVH